ncbi:MAG: SpoIIIAH-like family protein [Clostridia bacterium]|nr:SpoIIIAH-like family protein [Clostridia bacterium]
MTTDCTKELEAPQKKQNKFKAIVVKIGKKNFIIAGVVLLIGAAVLLNWVLFTNGSKTGYNYDKPSSVVSQEQTENKDGDKTEEKTQNTYFSATQVSRQKARDEALEVLKTVVGNENVDETAKNEALSGISTIASEIEKEANIESLITAKGFENCVAVLNGDSASIIVSAETLQPAQLAQINAIVYEQTGILPTNITIINK